MGYNMTPTIIFEALDYANNLVFHGKTKQEAVDHVFQRYGINKDYIWQCLLTEERLRVSL